MALTNFSNIVAAEVQLKLDEIWKEPQYAKNYTAKANTIKAILENQTATLVALEDPNMKNDVAIKWVDFCGDTADDATEADNCEQTACAEGAGKTTSPALDIFIDDCFSISQEELETSSIGFDEIVAQGMAAKIKNMLALFDKKAVAVIAANKGANPYEGDYTYDGTAKDTTIPADQYGAEDIIPYLQMVQEYNTGGDAYILDGGNLYKDFYLANKNAITLNGNTVALNDLYADFPYRHDIPGFAANALSAYTFLIDKGALAIANRAKFPSLASLAGARDGGWIHTASGNIMRYSIPVNMADIAPMRFVNQGSLIKQSLMIDVQHAIVCASGGEKVPTWYLKLRAGVFANPLRCDATNTGIISFVKGS